MWAYKSSPLVCEFGQGDPNYIKPSLQFQHKQISKDYKNAILAF